MAGEKDKYRFSFFRRLRGIKVRDIMTPRALVVTQDMNARDLAEKMIREFSKGYPVVDKNGKMVGFVTDRDILMRVIMKNINVSDLIAGDIMTKEPKIIGPNDTLEKLADILVVHRISKLPVIDEQGRLVGVVTATDVLRTAPKYLKILRYEYINRSAEGATSIGKCENCGAYEILTYKESLFICEGCVKILKKNKLTI